MGLDREMTIPKSRSDVTFQLVIILIVVIFMILAAINIIRGVALIPSFIWITLIVIIIRSGARDEGGLRNYVTNKIGDLAGRHFAIVSATNVASQEIQFGYELLANRFIRQAISIDKIETVEWETGQATDMAGHDMDDWHVCIWYDHSDPTKSEKRRKWARKPDQDIYIVGPSSRKEMTAALGLKLIALLRTGGAMLIQGEKENCYVRQRLDASESNVMEPK